MSRRRREERRRGERRGEESKPWPGCETVETLSRVPPPRASRTPTEADDEFWEMHLPELDVGWIFNSEPTLMDEVFSLFAQERRRRMTRVESWREQQGRVDAGWGGDEGDIVPCAPDSRDEQYPERWWPLCDE